MPQGKRRSGLHGLDGNVALDLSDNGQIQQLADQEALKTMYDCDPDRFDQVFAATAQLHGLRDGSLRILPAAEYRKLLTASPSPKSRSAPRQQEVLLVDFASALQALVKVRVRIDAILYVDYLSYHCIRGAWLITAKSFHIERRFEPDAA